MGRIAPAADPDPNRPALNQPVRLSLSNDQLERIAVALTAQFPALFRAARRFGLADALAEEAVQEAMLLFSQRIAQIAEGAERAYLFGCVARIASNLRRSAPVRHEIAHEPEMEQFASETPNATLLFEQKQARDLLDRVLDKLSPPLRDVFVLYEIEQLTMLEIAEALGLKPGTVSSRLHRARDEFEATLLRLGGTSMRQRRQPDGA